VTESLQKSADVNVVVHALVIMLKTAHMKNGHYNKGQCIQHK